jgi:hypothetical protein
MARDGISLTNSGMRGVEGALSGLYAVSSHSGRFIDFFLPLRIFFLIWFAVRRAGSYVCRGVIYLPEAGEL